MLHGVPKGVNLQKEMPGSDTYFFERYIPLGIQKRPNEDIRCVAKPEILTFLFWPFGLCSKKVENGTFQSKF